MFPETYFSPPYFPEPYFADPFAPGSGGDAGVYFPGLYFPSPFFPWLYFPQPAAPAGTVDLIPVYTVDSGPGLTTAQLHASGAMGGYASTTEWVGGVMFDLFGRASEPDADDNRRDYRCLFVYNNGDGEASDVRVYLTQGTLGGTLAVGTDPRPVSAADSTAPQATEITTLYTAPSGVTFVTPTTYADGLALGDLPAGFGRGVWFRRTPSATTDAADEYCDVTVARAAGADWTRRVHWQVETAVAAVSPAAPGYHFQFVPTPTPFVRVSADFMTEGGSRISWELDVTLNDAGPYDFQLQMSQSGVPDADDWVDVGPPARDPAYLVDPEARLWGMSATTHYRVVLTTAVGSYVSPAAHVFGVLLPQDWLNVREVVRKEKMYQRRFVGRRGFLLKAKRYGARCSCTNATTGEVGNSNCPTCYGQGLVGGYHPPVPMTFATADPEKGYEHVEYNENLGTTKKTVQWGRVVADLPVVHRDAWVSAAGSDERYYVHTVNEIAAWMDVPVVYLVEFRLAPRNDVLYRFPVTRPADDVPAWKQPTSITV